MSDYEFVTTGIVGHLEDAIVRPVSARLGNPTLSASQNRIDVPLSIVDTPGMVYIYGIEGDPQSFSMALNSGIGQLQERDKIFGAFIRVRKEGRQWVLAGTDPRAQGEYMYGVDPRVQSPIVISQFDFGLLQPTAPASMKCIVSGGIYYINGIPYMVQAQETHDFTSDIPGTGGQAKAVLVTLDPTTGALDYTVGSAFDMTLSHFSAFTLYPANPDDDDGVFTIGWVKLINGMTAITGSTHVLPAQELLNKKLITFEGGVVINDLGAAVDFRVEGDTDANALVVNGTNDNVGVGTATPDDNVKFEVVSTTKGSIPAPIQTSAQRATLEAIPPPEAAQVYDGDMEQLYIFDGQRFRAVGVAGWAPVALPLLFVPSGAFTSGSAIPSNGGSLAIAMHVTANMLLESVSVENRDTAGAREWGWDLYRQFLNNGNSGENTLTRVVASNGTEAYTASAASVRTLNAAAVTYLEPGIYWLVIQNRHASQNFSMGFSATSAVFGINGAQTKTTTNPNGSTLDFVAATWTKSTAIWGARMNGRVFGDTAVF